MHLLNKCVFFLSIAGKRLASPTCTLQARRHSRQAPRTPTDTALPIHLFDQCSLTTHTESDRMSATQALENSPFIAMPEL